MFNNIILILLQGDQGYKGEPGPFEYVEPKPEDYVKGETVKHPYVKQVFICWGFTRTPDSFQGENDCGFL